MNGATAAFLRPSILVSLLCAVAGCSAREVKNPDRVDLNAEAGRRIRARNVYSPEIASDPYVIDEQRRIAQALRMSCEKSKTYCEEADAADQFVAEADARR